MCDKCLNQELLRQKKSLEELQRRQEQEAELQTAEKLKEYDEQERQRRQEQQQKLKQEALAAQAEAEAETAQRRQKIRDSSDREMYELTNVEAEKVRRAESQRRTEEAQRYRQELRSQMDARRQAAKELQERERQAERTQHGLELDCYKGSKFQAQKEQHVQALQEQMIAERIRRSKDPKEEEAERLAQYKVHELVSTLNVQKEEEEQKRKADMKGQYQSFIQEKEAQAAQEKARKMQEQAAYLEQLKGQQARETAERMHELDKKRQLSEYLAAQIQAKEAQRAAAREQDRSQDVEVTENANRREDRRQDTRAVKEANLRMMEEKAAGKAQERSRQVQAEQEELQRLQQLQEQRQQDEQRKKAQQRKDMEAALRQTEAKRGLKSAGSEPQDLPYYEALNKQLQDLIQEERAQQKAKTQEYKDELQSQIASNEEAKRRQKQQDVDQAHLTNGLEFDSYRRNPVVDRAQYNRDIQRQYKESLAQKSASKHTPAEAEQVNRMNELAEQMRRSQSEEEWQRKQEQKADYLRSLESRQKLKRESEQQKALERDQQREAERHAQSVREHERLLQADQRPLLHAALATQMEAERAKRSQEKATRCDWMDEKAQKQAAELEDEMSKLREEILRCIKCNAVLKSKQLQGRMPKPLT